jgi:hypothetical protein
MADDSVWIEDESPTSAPPAPRFELPRLQIIHLMMWMAATAAAFVPYRAQLDAIERDKRESPNVSRAEPATAVWVAYGITHGTLLFVAVAAIVWRKRGYVGPFAPGHHLAFQGAAYWALSAITWAALQFADVSYLNAYSWFSAPQALMSLVFFIWFLRLAIKRGHTTAWRWAFVMAALGPPLVYALRVAGAYILYRSGLGFNGLVMSVAPQCIVSLLQLTAIVAAMAGDRRHTPPRHWSHWLAASARLAMLATMIAYFLYLIIYSSQLTGR